MSQKPSLLFFTAWWPHKSAPFEGLFVQEHAKSISSFFNIQVVQLKIQKSNTTAAYKINIESCTESDITVHRVYIKTRIRRFGIHNWLIKKAFTQIISELRSKHHFFAYHLNIRTHITRFIPYLTVLNDLPFVHTEHFTYYHNGINSLNNHEKALEIERIIKWFQNPLLKCVMPVSLELANVLVHNFNCPQNKVTVVPNIANQTFSYQAFELPLDQINILMAASWSGNKRPIQLFQAINELPKEEQDKLSIHIVGEGDLLSVARVYQSDHLPQLEVQYHGFQSKNYISELIPRCHFLAHPTVSENSPTIISEALSSGLPILSMKVNGIPELVSESNGILVEPNNIASLSKALLNISRKAFEYDRNLISKEAQHRFSPKVIGKDISNILLELK